MYNLINSQNCVTLYIQNNIYLHIRLIVLYNNFKDFTRYSMRIIVISDSHGNRSGIDKIFNQMEFDYLFFLGDGLQDLGSYIYLDNVIAVSGNCDYFTDVENELDFTIDGKKFFITHGNKYGVKYSMNSLMNKARELGVKYCMYGHTHRQIVEKVDEVYYINPGTFQRGKNDGLIIDIDTDIKICDIKNYL